MAADTQNQPQFASLGYVYMGVLCVCVCVRVYVQICVVSMLVCHTHMAADNELREMDSTLSSVNINGSEFLLSHHQSRVLQSDIIKLF